MRSADIAMVTERVRAGGGVVRSAQLVRDAIPPGLIAAAVEQRALVRVRRTWVALPDADPHLIAAARAGVTLSCITQAQRIGLWVLAVDRPHVAANAHAGRVHLSGARVHRAEPLMPRHPDALADPIENVLALVSACQPFDVAHAVWESALRQGLVDRAELLRLPLRETARAVLEVATPFSDSGLESFVVPRIRWLGLRIVPQAWIAGHRVDFLLGERLVLQIDGGHHVGAQRDEDVRHDAELMARGYFVIRVGYRHIVDDWPGVQMLIMRAVAQGLHRAA
ncbi:endonuclease domain-containing protein [Microbacterium sp. P07]|uniref:endonuclease domain-containing protein n=1 Tax=Microbacterium sp. P07 TaxID=3366952 RepID=UPI003746D6F6